LTDDSFYSLNKKDGSRNIYGADYGMKLSYTGFPFHLTLNGRFIMWRNILDFKLKETRTYGEDTVDIEGWKFSGDYAATYINEHRKWEKDYVPPSGLRGKTVLDIGAGCGETAKFFLEHGAAEVIAVEPYDVALRFLRLNAVGRSIRVVPQSFSTEMLSLTHQFLKMDIEGYEALMIPFLDSYHGDCSVECHGNYVTDTFMSHGFVGDSVSGVGVKGHTGVLHRWVT